MEIKNIPFPVVAILGEVELTFQEYLDLKKGDILLLNQAINRGIEIRIGPVSTFLATLGLYESQKAVSLDERLYS